MAKVNLVFKYQNILTKNNSGDKFVWLIPQINRFCLRGKE